ncbi:MAG TPA: hypothetical protein VHV77_15165 [Pirellulales bacterium]|jgi:hypothetical protein|nr:hypothetical protein [Pirellulales bacterium]
MSRSCWVLDDVNARLDSQQLSADVNLALMCPSMTHVAYRGQPLGGASLLGVALEGATSERDAPKLDDAYVRGADLVATWPAAGASGLRVQLYWRRIATIEAPDVAVVELQVSVNTPLWNTDAQQTATSLVPGTEVLRMTDRDGLRFESMSLGSANAELDTSGVPTACILFRPHDGDFSYAEMVHPNALSKTFVMHRGSGVALEHRLFVSSLEKGVILRARVRGALVPRETDQRDAASIYAQFATSEPPLTA